MNERIKRVRKCHHLSQEEFGEKIGVTRDIISNIELGRVEPKPLLLNHMCVIFHVNRDWLETGEGSMISSLPKEEYLSSLGLSEMGKQIIDTFLDLESKDQAVIEDFFLRIAKKITDNSR